METVYDWVTVGIFAALIVLFLQRSTSENVERDAPLYYYLIGGLGCAAANYFGNKNQDIVAVLILAATLGFIVYFLKPFNLRQDS